MALRLAQHHQARLNLWDVDEAGVADTSRECSKLGGESRWECCDLGRGREVKGVVARMLRDWGPPEILINNAGICFHGPTTQMKPFQWDQILKVNLLAPVQLTRLLLPHLLAHPPAHILNVSSIFGLVATNRCAAYHLTNFGLVGFSEALRAEFNNQGLGVTALCPGFVPTGLFGSVTNETVPRAPRHPPRWLCTTPDRVAQAGIRGIQRNRRLVLVSPAAHLLYQARRFSPGLFDTMYRVLDRRYFSGRTAGRQGSPELVPVQPVESLIK